jgi:hypothetical protein
VGALLAVSSKATLTNWSQADLARCDWIAKAGKEAQADLWDGLPAIEHAGGRRQNDRTDPAKGVRRGRRASGLFRPVSRASRRRQPSTPSTPSTTCLLPLVRRYDPPLPRSWPKGFPARKPNPGLSYSASLRSPYRNSGRPGIQHSPVPNPLLSKANIRKTLIYLFPSMNHITIKAKGASANQSDESLNSI